MKTRTLFCLLFIGSLLLLMPRQTCAQWTESGVPIVVYPGDQVDPRLVPDGVGGAVIAWLDYRNGDTDIYAQRIDRNGYTLWAADGVPVCDAAGYQEARELIPEAIGGAIIVWQDQRDGTNHIYAQRVNGEGLSLWTHNGVAVCPAAGGQLGPRIAPDECGGAIIVWKDGRNGAGDYYAQRVDSSGTPLWAADGIPICTVPVGDFSASQYPRIIPDGSGGAIVAWVDTRTHKDKVFAQRVDAKGSLLWTNGGVGVSTRNVDQTMQELIPDGTGGAIITWQRDRPYTVYADIDAQRIDSAGTVRWGDTAVVICTGQWRCFLPTLAPDCCGGAFIAWNDGQPDGKGTHIQRVDAAGSIQWQQNGVSPFSHDVSFPQLVSDGNDGIIVVGTGGVDGDSICVQRVESTGASLWAMNGVLLHGVDWNLERYFIASDGAGGAIVPWNEQKAGGGGWNIFAKKIDSDGSIPVPTLLQSYFASVGKEGIAVTWVVSTEAEALMFAISRAEGAAGAFDDLPSTDISRQGASFTFIDRGCESGVSYRYRVSALEGDRRVILFETALIPVPTLPLTLYQNYPNPFNPETRIGYYLPAGENVRLEVYDAAGRRISVLVDGYQNKGPHGVQWAAKTPEGGPLSSGIYFCRLTAGKGKLSRKMTLLR